MRHWRLSANTVIGAAFSDRLGKPRWQAPKYGSREEHAGCPRRRIDKLRPECADQTERRRRECIGRLRHPDDKGHSTGDIILDELDLGNKWRQRGRITEAKSEQDDTCEQQRDRLSS